MQTFGRQSTTLLTTSLRAVSQIGPPQIEEMSYDEFVTRLPEQTVSAVLTLDPWPGKALMTFDLSTLLAMIDHQLGGMGSPVQPDRPLTDIEQTLVRQLLARVLRELAYALEPVHKGVEPELLGLEPDPRFVQAAAPTDPVVVATMELTVGQHVSPFSLCLPYAMLSPAFENLSRSGDSTAKTQLRLDAAAQTQARLSDVEVAVSVRLEPLRMQSQTIGRLTIGDVLSFGHRTTAPMAVTSANAVFAQAVPGSSGRTLAVLIVSGR